LPVVVVVQIIITPVPGDMEGLKHLDKMEDLGIHKIQEVEVKMVMVVMWVTVMVVVVDY
jgi:hypothetical protein